MPRYVTEFTVAELKARAGDAAFRAAGGDVVDIDGPDEDEWSLYAIIRTSDGQELETMLHHRAGKPLSGECGCSEGEVGKFCSHQVYVGLQHLDIEASPESALAAEQASAEFDLDETVRGPDGPGEEGHGRSTPEDLVALTAAPLSRGRRAAAGGQQGPA